MNKWLTPLALFASALFLSACSTMPKTQADRDELHNDATAAFNTFQQTDPTLSDFLKDAYGYAIFPTVGKGGAGIGGAYGHGEAYEQGQLVGYSDLSQATIGLQLGGESFSELVVFQNKSAMESFKAEEYSFSANASAVAATAGAAAASKYDNGVAVFVKVNGGLMAEAAIGGQKFDFAPLVTPAPAAVTPVAAPTPPPAVTPPAVVTPPATQTVP
jgi:lipid-binding SYLF domain-containing protein